MGVSYTEDQQKVIDLRDCNILVSAAAGSGKTAVLTERIVKRVCDKTNPVWIDRMLIVTFTNAAAAEMRERIGVALRKQLDCEPGNDHLRKQITLLNHAQITTIDSFCLYLLRNHFHEIHLDPAFRIADDGEMKLLRQEVLEEYLEKKYEEGDASFLQLVEQYASAGKEDILKDIILCVYDYSQSQPFPQEYLNELLMEISSEQTGISSTLQNAMYEYEKSMLEECILLTEEAIKLCRMPKGPYHYVEALEDDLKFYRQLQEETAYEKREPIYREHKFKTLSRSKVTDLDELLKDSVKEIRDKRCKKIVEEIKKRFYYASLPQILLDNNMAGESLSTFIKLALDFTSAFEAQKRDKNMIDFSDMEHLALKILVKKTEQGYVPGEVAKGYQDFFQEVMVDEYQDSNQVQEFLLESISKQTADKGNRFMVGDVKQSIYRFRLARPEIFMEKYETFSSKEGKNRRIDLSFNFRSRMEVIESVNCIFENLMIPQVGKIQYDRNARLYYHADYKESDGDYKSEILFYDKEKFEDETLMDAEAEAKIIAHRIRRLCRECKIKDKKDESLRNVRFSDIVILLRTAAGVDDVMKKVLEKEGIPTYISSGKGYFAAPEIRILIHYIHILNNPRQDIPLLGVLHSALGGFSEEEIATIRMVNQKKGRLYDSLLQYALVGSDMALREKVGDFLEELEQWRERACFVTVYELLDEIMQKSGYMNYCMSLPGGSQRRANLLVLLQKARAFENGGYSGLFDFIRYIELMKEREIDFGEANILDENANVVRIMTIHKSKGLEFPVCFVAGFSKQFHDPDGKMPLITDADLGMGCDCIDLTTRCKRKSLRRNVIEVKQKTDGRGEDLRILYVAMTRAKEKLIMVGKGTPVETGVRNVNAYDIIKAKSFMELVLPIAAAHEEAFAVKEYLPEELELGKAVECIEAQLLKQDLINIKRERIWEPYHYPHTSLEGLYTKTTVSELKKEAYLESEEPCQELYADAEVSAYVPRFIEKKEEEVGGARRGSAYHRIMELMDFTLAFQEELSKADLEKLETEAVDSCRIPGKEAALVSTERIMKFMQTPLAVRMGKAQENNKLYREQPFMLSVKANTVKAEFPEEDILVQGVIDVFFEEEDGLVVLDYKTDRVTEAAELVKRYETQLAYYAEALERLTHKKVKEKLIYSFALHETICV